MKIRAIAPWFGGKRSMSSVITKQLGEHTSYWEPFCGSCAVLFAKEPCQQETVLDLHSGLTNLARVLADPVMAPDLYGRAARTLYANALYYDSLAWLDANPFPPEGAADPEAAYHFLVVSWQGRNGTSGSVRNNFAPSVRFTPGGGASPIRWKSAVESIPGWHERLRNVAIMNRDAFEIIPRIADEPGVAIYVDPPYLKSTRGLGGGSMYVHDFDEVGAPLFGVPDDHANLADMLRRFENARVVVSYYDHPQVRSLYVGWTVVEHTRQKNLHVQNRRGVGACEAPEVLIINGEAIE
jgi:DNA adenine methylase